MERDSQRSSDGMLLLQGHIYPRGASCRPSWRATEGPRGSVMSHCSSKSSSEPPGAAANRAAWGSRQRGARCSGGGSLLSRRSGAARMVEATQHKPSKATQVCVIHRSACRP